jgi:hypothetical protein
MGSRFDLTVVASIEIAGTVKAIDEDPVLR